MPLSVKSAFDELRFDVGASGSRKYFGPVAPPCKCELLGVPSSARPVCFDVFELLLRSGVLRCGSSFN